MQPRDVAEESAARQEGAAHAIQLSNEPQEEVSCPVCGKDETDLVMYARDRLFGQPGTYRLVQCRHCNMRYLSPRPTLAALGSHYPDDYFIYKTPDEIHPLMRPVMSAVGRQRWRSYIRRFERVRGRFSANTRIVDVGCGQNDHLATLQKLRGCQGIGVDFKPEMVVYVRDRLKMPIFQGTLQDAHFEDGQFEVVTMNEYLEHEPDPRGVLTEARRITVKGGHLGVEIPFIEGLPARMFGSRWSQIDAPRHLSYFTRDTLAQLLQRCGYRLIHTQTFQIPLLIGLSVLQLFGAKRVGRLGLFESTLAAMAAMPFYLAYPLMDEFMFAVAEAE